MPIIETFFFGPLRVLIDTATGRVIGTQDRISGCAASLRYAPAYIRAAEDSALRAFESTHEPA